MFNPQTSPDTGSATSSPASPVGPLQLDLLGGPTTASSGPEAPRASRSPSRVREKPRMTIGTCGPTSFASSVPDGPLSSWESRLRRRLARTGSTECLLTWKESTTPAGRPLSRLVPSTRPTEGIACGLWRTPNAHVVDAKSNVVKLEGRKPSDPQVGLADQVAALWPTPCARDHMPAHSKEYIEEKKAQGHGMSILPDYAVHAHMALYPTPRASANENRTTKIPPSQLDGRHGLYLSSVAIGMEPDGSSATTEKPGALNPAFVCWLMGFPAAWDACAPTATPSSRKSPQK